MKCRQGSHEQKTDLQRAGQPYLFPEPIDRVEKTAKSIMMFTVFEVVSLPEFVNRGNPAVNQ